MAPDASDVRGRRGESPTREELMAEARGLDIRGRSEMGRAELRRAVALAK